MSEFRVLFVDDEEDFRETLIKRMQKRHVFYRGSDRTALVGLAVAGSLASAIASVIMYRQLGAGETRQILGSMLIADKMGYLLSAVFAVTTALTALMSPGH